MIKNSYNNTDNQNERKKTEGNINRLKNIKEKTRILIPLKPKELI